MRAIVCAILLCLGGALVVEAQNPFLADDSSAGTEAKQAVGAREESPPFWYPIVIWQKRINDSLSRALRGLRDGFSFAHVLLVFGISLVYSLVHTAGPGHGKLILSTYFLTADRRYRARDAALAGGIVSLTHIGTAFALSLILWLALNTLSMASQRDMADVARRIGGALVILTGIVMALVSLFGDRLEHRTNKALSARFKGLPLYAIAVLSGIVPCPLAWFVLVFTMSYGIYAYGVLSIVGMAIGAAITVGGSGLLVLAAREKTMSFVAAGVAKKVAYGLRLAGGFVLILLGSIMVLPR